MIDCCNLTALVNGGAIVSSEFGDKCSSLAIDMSGVRPIGADINDAAFQNDAKCATLNNPVTSSEGGADKKAEVPKPKRPLSAYNFFFHNERQNILKDTPTRKEGKPRRSHGKIGFADLARMIAAKWKSISKEDRAIFDEKAAADKERYQKEMNVWKKEQSAAATHLAKTGVGNQDQPPKSSSIFSDPLSSGFMRQPSSFLRNTFDRVRSYDFLAEDERKMSGADMTPTEPYSLNEVFGRNFTQPLQPALPPEAPNQRTSSPKISDLASKMGDEGAQLFMSLFRSER